MLPFAAWAQDPAPQKTASAPASTPAKPPAAIISTTHHDWDNPYFAHEYLMGLAALSLGLCAWSRRRGNKGATLRFAATAVALYALANHQVITSSGTPDITEALIVVDRTASQQFNNRSVTADQAEKQLQAALANIPGVQTRILNILDQADGTRMIDKIEEALSDVPYNRRGGIFIVSDGQVHDQIPAQDAADDKTPIHLLRTGQEREFDRRVEFEPFERAAQVKKPHEIKFRVTDEGPVPTGGETRVAIFKDGKPVTTKMVKPGEVSSVNVEIDHAGANVIEVRTDEVRGEITPRNNSALTSVNGIMPKMNILLATGKINENTPAFRKMFNSDDSVNIVTFAVGRPPDKIDATPEEELVLNPFPFDEIFSDNIKLFNLVIIDNTSNLKLLPPEHMRRLVQYVKDGGALLIAAGPELNSKEFMKDIYDSPLKEIIPAGPGAGASEEMFKPQITPRGQRHPAMRGLPGANTPDAKSPPTWGPWYRQVDITQPVGETVMEGVDKKPLLLLSRQGEGRVALLASDSLWRWELAAPSEKGPYAQMINQVSHWLMKNPVYDEESLKLEASAQDIEVVLQTMGDSPKAVSVQMPSGKIQTVTPQAHPQQPGLWTMKIPAEGIGAYSAQAADKTGPVAYNFVGQESPREYAGITSTDKILQPWITRHKGGSVILGTPNDNKQIIPAIKAIAPQTKPEGYQGPGWLGVQMTAAMTNVREEKKPFIDPAWLAGAGGLLLALSYLQQANWRNPFRRDPSQGPATPQGTPPATHKKTPKAEI
ncbi:MAG TPA: hypothetical protein VGD95_01260 [Micavibrio sp.]